MFDAYNAQSKNIGELLSDSQPCKLTIPTFQRGYSWEKKHVNAFWGDICQFQKDSVKQGGPTKYFLGPIVIMPGSSPKDEISVLDGQQRLATSTILLSVLRDLARTLTIKGAEAFAEDIQNHFINKEDIGSTSLDLGELDKSYFFETIQSDPPIARKPTLRSHRHIQAARDLLMEEVKKQIAPMNPTEALAELKKLKRTLRTDLIMACIPVKSERDAFLIFETLNDRGLRLSTPDLLLNFLMRVAAKDADRAGIRGLWNDMLTAMGRRDITRFLRHMWVSRYGDLKSQDLFSALKQHIEDGSISSLIFARDCEAECTRYVELWEASKEHFEKAAPFIRALIRELGYDSSLPLLLSAYSFFTPADLEKIARWLLVFVARYSIVMRLDSSGLETVFFKLARDIRAMMTDPKTGKPDPKNAKATLAHIKAELKKNAPTDKQLEVTVPGLILEQEEAAYIVSRIAARMQSGTKEVGINESNLEHVFPKKPSAEWTDPAKLEPFLWHIGNLTMLGERLNASTGVANLGYPKKRAHYQKASELVMAQQLAKDHSSWDEAAIKDRAKKLQPFITEIWNFDNPSRV